MKHMLGDYYSSMPTDTALWIALVLFVLLIVVILVSLRRAKVRADRVARQHEKYVLVKPRATYIAAQRMKVEESSDSFNNRR